MVRILDNTTKTPQGTVELTQAVPLEDYIELAQEKLTLEEQYNNLNYYLSFEKTKKFLIENKTMEAICYFSSKALPNLKSLSKEEQIIVIKTLQKYIKEIQDLCIASPKTIFGILNHTEGNVDDTARILQENNQERIPPEIFTAYMNRIQKRSSFK